MEPTLPSDAVLRRDARNGTVTFLRAHNLSEWLKHDSAFRGLQTADRFADIALAFLTVYRELFRLQNPPSELLVKSVDSDPFGLKHVRLQQVFEGISVWGAELIVHLDRANHVYLVQGRYAPTPANLNTRPALSREEILRIVARDLARGGLACPRCQETLVIFITADSTPRLAYRVLATVSLVEGWAYMVDAGTGAILEKGSTVMR